MNSLAHYVTMTNSPSSLLLLHGSLDGYSVDYLVDSGVSLSLLQIDVVPNMDINIKSKKIHLQNASSSLMNVVGTISLFVKLEKIGVMHEFFVVDKLLHPVILGIDFLTRYNVHLEFSASGLKFGGCAAEKSF